MAENLKYNEPANGTTIAADDVSGVKYQYVKLAGGGADVTAGIPGDATNGLYTNIKASVPLELTDGYGFELEMTPMGEARVVEPVRLVGTSFEGSTIDGNFWTTAAGGGTGGSPAIAQGSAAITLTTGTASGNAVTSFTLRRARYVCGEGMRYRAVVLSSNAGTANNKKRWGVGWGSTAMPAVTDGAYFQWDGTTFGIRIRKGDTETVAYAIDSGSFNGTYGATWAPTADQAYTYEIYWTNSRIWFVIGGDILHTINTQTVPATWANTMSFHVFMDTLNSGTATTSTLQVRVATIYRLGKLKTQPTYKHIAATTIANYVCKYGGGFLHTISINNPSNAAITLFDATTNTAGTEICVLTPQNNTNPFTVDLHCPFNNALTVRTSNDVTVVYE